MARRSTIQIQNETPNRVSERLVAYLVRPGAAGNSTGWLFLRWLLAALAGAATAAVAAWLWAGARGPSAPNLLFGPAVTPRAMKILLAAFAVQGVVGLFLWQREGTPGGSGRVFAAELLLEGAAGILFAVLPLLAATWTLASQGAQAAMALEFWGAWEANHGPWRHAAELRGLLWLAFPVPFLALLSALASLALNPSRKAAGLVALAAVAEWILLATHHWLVD